MIALPSADISLIGAVYPVAQNRNYSEADPDPTVADKLDIEAYTYIYTVIRSADTVRRPQNIHA